MSMAFLKWRSIIEDAAFTQHCQQKVKSRLLAATLSCWRNLRTVNEMLMAKAAAEEMHFHHCATYRTWTRWQIWVAFRIIVSESLADAKQCWESRCMAISWKYWSQTAKLQRSLLEMVRLKRVRLKYACQAWFTWSLDAKQGARFYIDAVSTLQYVLLARVYNTWRLYATFHAREKKNQDLAHKTYDRKMKLARQRAVYHWLPMAKAWFFTCGVHSLHSLKGGESI